MKAKRHEQRPVPRYPGRQDPSSLTRVRPSAPPLADGYEPQIASFLQRMGALFTQNVVGNRVTAKISSTAQQGGLSGLLMGGEPIGIAELPQELLKDLEGGLEGPLRGLIESPHAGMRHGVFDFAEEEVAKLEGIASESGRFECMVDSVELQQPIAAARAAARALELLRSGSSIQAGDKGAEEIA